MPNFDFRVLVTSASPTTLAAPRPEVPYSDMSATSWYWRRTPSSVALKDLEDPEEQLAEKRLLQGEELLEEEETEERQHTERQSQSCSGIPWTNVAFITLNASSTIAITFLNKM